MANLTAIAEARRVSAEADNRRAYRLDAIDMLRGLVISGGTGGHV